MEFEGTVWSVLPVVKGTSARGEWVNRAQEAGALQKGETVSVSANVESREYNGRWFTEVRAWRIARKAAQPQAPASDGLPPLDAFAPEDAAPSSGAAEVDDLPF